MMQRSTPKASTVASLRPSVTCVMIILALSSWSEAKDLKTAN